MTLILIYKIQNLDALKRNKAGNFGPEFYKNYVHDELSSLK